MKPDLSQSGCCTCRLDQLNPHRLCTSPFSSANVISRLRVAGDDAEFGADHVVEEYREVARGRAWRVRAGDELRGQEIGKRFHRRVAARQADVIVNGGGAE